MLMGLATASLLLPVFFAREFLGIDQQTPLSEVINPTVYCSWAFLATAVFSGVVFHYLSAKWVHLAWGKSAGVLCFKLSDAGTERALNVFFWLTVAGFFRRHKPDSHVLPWVYVRIVNISRGGRRWPRQERFTAK